MIRLGLAVLTVCGVAAYFAWSKPDNTDQHRLARQLILNSTLSRVNDPVIVVGDSIVEASTLPRSICGHPIVNAGLIGSSTASDLGAWLALALDGKRAALIVVSLGINDALVSNPQSKESFADRYALLLDQLSKLTPQLAALEIPQVEAKGRTTAGMRDEAMSTINGYNSILPDLAARHGANFVSLLAMPKLHTMDGVHLNSDGYQAWDNAVMQAATKICT